MSEWPGKKHVGIQVIFVNMIASNDAYNAKGRVGHVYHNHKQGKPHVKGRVGHVYHDRKQGKCLISSKIIIF